MISLHYRCAGFVFGKELRNIKRHYYCRIIITADSLSK